MAITSVLEGLARTLDLFYDMQFGKSFMHGYLLYHDNIPLLIIQTFIKKIDNNSINKTVHPHFLVTH